MTKKPLLNNQIETAIKTRLEAEDTATKRRPRGASKKPKNERSVIALDTKVWVLASNGIDPLFIADGLSVLLHLSNFKPERSDALHKALGCYSAGMP